jgi:SAM-dependent methyltransferase
VIALVASCGRRVALDVARWRCDAADDEVAVLAAVPDPVLDVGCGPGRIVAALAAAGRPALGIDPAPAAVAEAAGRGAPVLCRSVFDPLPGEGRWGSVVLLDGNIGIGGDPVALLRRARDLVRPGGRVVAEVGPPGTPTERMAVRLQRRRRPCGPWFPWATVAADRFPPLAAAAGLGPGAVTAGRGRWFAEATR